MVIHIDNLLHNDCFLLARHMYSIGPLGPDYQSILCLVWLNGWLSDCCAGHARVYVAFDVLYRYLRHLGYDVQYVRNFTDVDDKIIKRAAELSIAPSELSQK